MLMAPDLGLWAVCDGMGGHVGGQVASQLAVRTIEQTLRSGQAPGGDDLDILVTAIKNANFAIFNQARSDPSLHNMGTTVVGIRQEGAIVHLCHVGDSRIYRLSGASGDLVQVTRDHSLVNLYEDNPELARRYADSCPELCEPYDVPAPVKMQGSEAELPAQASYCYHGTRAHRREIEWLLPVVREVQAACPEARFEIFGDWRVRRLYRDIPRVSVRAPMTWPEYLAYSSTVRHQLGLAPCLDTPFNRARSHVKLFDITRFGAAGIYSDAEPYARRIRNGETGWLCPNRQQDWVWMIVRALRDPQECGAVHARALHACRHERGAFPAL